MSVGGAVVPSASITVRVVQPCAGERAPAPLARVPVQPPCALCSCACVVRASVVVWGGGAATRVTGGWPWLHCCRSSRRPARRVCRVLTVTHHTRPGSRQAPRVPSAWRESTRVRPHRRRTPRASWARTRVQVRRECACCAAPFSPHAITCRQTFHTLHACMLVCYRVPMGPSQRCCGRCVGGCATTATAPAARTMLIEAMVATTHTLTP